MVILHESLGISLFSPQVAFGTKTAKPIITWVFRVCSGVPPSILQASAPPCCRSTSPKSHPAVGAPVPDRKCGTRLTCGSGAMRRAILQMALVCSAFLKTCQFIVHMAAVCSGCVPACSAKPTITSVFRGVRLGYILLYVRNVVAGARDVLRPHIEYYTGALFSILPRCPAPARQPSRTPGGLGSGKRARTSSRLGSGKRARSSSGLGSVKRARSSGGLGSGKVARRALSRACLVVLLSLIHI